MSGEAWRRAKDLFDGAIERRPDERLAYLAAASADDAALRREVELLLDAHESAGDFLETPVGAESSVAVGDSIGPYRVIRELGRGGMGVVFLAERADGAFHKRVAIKVVRQGLGAREMIRRFHAERRILARLEHPSIAQLLDGGNTASGDPYFVVEYVEGEPIDRFCDSRRLSIAERLELFRSVASAVDFAHRNLVVHRDLKPSNVLVTADGSVKLLDFGIAKLLGPGSFSRESASTVLGARPMTPDYTSPEQVEGGPITTATDVYALGLLLYKLLTGRRAYRLERKTPQELEEKVCRRAPLRPSQAVLLAEPGEAARESARDRDPKALARRLAGDLDTIVLKALRKEPERRYTSVEQLSADVGRHLAGLPVRARPDSFRYRGGKFVRRHKVGVAVAVGWVLVVLGFGVAMAIQQQRLTRERDRAELNAVRMAAERDKAQQTEEFLVRIFELSDPAEARGETITARELLDRGARRVEKELADQPEVQADLMNTMGRAYLSLGLYQAARPQLERALELRRRGRLDESVGIGESLHELAWLRGVLGDYAASERLYREALAMRRKLLGVEHADVADSLDGLAAVLFRQGESAAAEPLLRQALAMRRRLFGDEHQDVAASLNNLALLLTARGDHEAAEPLLREALSTGRRLFGPEHTSVATYLLGLAALERDRGNYAAAEPLFEESLSIFRKLLGEEHVNVGIVLQNGSELYRLQGKYDQAASRARQALRIYEQTLPRGHYRVALARGVLGESLAGLGHLAQAEPQLLESYESLLEADPSAARVATARERLIGLYEAWGKPAEAARYRALLDIAESRPRR